MLIEVPADQMNSVTVPGLMSVPNNIIVDHTTNAAEPEPEPVNKKAILAGMIAKINEGFSEAEEHTSENLEKHRAVGKALAEAKAYLKAEKFKPVGGWRGWTDSMGWSTRWCDYLIRLDVEWDAVQDAIAWKRGKGVAIDGVCGALQALNDHKRENETDDEKEQREEKEAARTQGKGTKKARQIAAARFIAAVLAGKSPSLDDVQVGEFVRETLVDQPDGFDEITEKSSSHSDDFEPDIAHEAPPVVVDEQVERTPVAVPTADNIIHMPGPVEKPKATRKPRKPKVTDEGTENG